MTAHRPSVEFHEGTLRLRGFRLRFMHTVFADLPIVLDDRDDCFRCDAMHYDEIAARLDRRLAGSYCDEVSLDERLVMKRQLDRSLRPDQAAAVNAFDAGGRRGLVVMPTGTGKTVVALELMLRAQTSTLVVVPVRDLMYQWHREILAATAIDAGLIGDGVHRVSPISVTTYDSAAIHMPRIGHRFALIIFDEVHHLAGPWRSDAARMSAARQRLGLTATLPTDSDRLQRLHDLIGPTLYQQSIGEASGQSLAKYTVQRIAVEMTDEENQQYRSLSKTVQQFVYDQRSIDPHFRWEDVYRLTGATDAESDRAFQAKQALRAFRAKRRIEERAAGKLRVLEDLFRLHAEQPVIVFVGSNAMAREVSLRFLIPCLLSHCGKKERQELLEGFAVGRYRALVANRVLDEGVDLPEVKVAVVLGGLSSSRQAVQRLGRVLRKGSSGKQAVLYEVVTDQTKEVERSRSRRRHDAYRRKRQRNRLE